MGRSKILTLLKPRSTMCFWIEVEQGLEKTSLYSQGNAFLWELLTAHSQLRRSFLQHFQQENTAQLAHLRRCRAEQNPRKHSVTTASGLVP